MLSKKLTFSLVVISILAFGFGFVSDTLAQAPIPVLSVIDELDEVVKEADRQNQITLYDWAGDFSQPDGIDDVNTQIKIRDVMFPDVTTQNADLKLYLRLHTGRATLKRDQNDAIENATATRQAAYSTLTTDAAKAAHDAINQYLHPHDLSVAYFDKNNQVLVDVLDQAGTTIMPRNPQFPDGQNFLITIAHGDIPDNARFMTVSIGARSFKDIDPRDTFRTPGAWNAPSVLPDSDPFKIRTYTKDEAAAANKASGATAGDASFVKEGDPKPESLELFLINEDPADPEVISMVRTVTATSARSDAAATQFGGDPVSGEFMVKVTFSEEPDLVLEDDKDPTKGYKLADLPFKVVNAKITNIAKGTPFFVNQNFREGDYVDGAGVPGTTGYDRRYHPYLLTLEPDLKTTENISIYVQKFEDLFGKRYNPPNNASRVNTRSMLHVSVLATAVTKPIADVDAYKNLEPRGNEYALPAKTVIPAEGYLVIARGTAAESGVPAVSAEKYKDETDPARADNQTDFNFSHNVLHEQDFKVDLSNFFRQGGTIQLRYENIPDNPGDLVKKTQYQASDAVIASKDVIISEVMWGNDSANTALKTQWIELHNRTDADISIDDREWVLNFSPSNALPSRHTQIVDEIGNNPSSGYWPVPGSDGVSVTSVQRPVIEDRVSMFRDPGAPVDAGTAQASWVASAPRGNSLNFTGRVLGTPGGATNYTAPVEDDEEPVVVVVPPAAALDLLITEIMVPSNSGTLPQWIEIKNVSGSEVSLKGWQVNIVNDASDTDVITTSLNIDLSDVVLDKNQVALVVSKTGRNSGTDKAGVARTAGDANAGMFDADRIVNASVQLKPATRNYSILSESAFSITLVPPSPITSGADGVGNLVGGWELPMSDVKGERSSIIRREMGKTAEIKGTDAAGWVLASDTSLLGGYVETYYGDSDDVGTPGYDAIGALPVELSKFGAKRDPLTGQVVITWETQSELNNAGFFIKRAQHKTAQFVPVNPTMIPGAGTTSEKQSYTYTDTTAKPNIVYYYQIEDVSLDGNRQTLTRAHRLKGHIGAAGKLSTMWGELKERE